MGYKTVHIENEHLELLNSIMCGASADVSKAGSMRSALMCRIKNVPY
jgi:hypothetical protein